MKKHLMSLGLAIVMLFSMLCTNAFAVEPDNTLVIPPLQLQHFDKEAYMNTVNVNKEQMPDADVAQPRAINANRKFQVKELWILPAIKQNGKLTYLDTGFQFPATSNAMNVGITKAGQAALKSAAESYGYTFEGYYILGFYEVDCWIPNQVIYHKYSHVDDGKEYHAQALSNGLNSLELYCKVPDDNTETLKYGMNGYASMTCYILPSSAYPNGSSEQIQKNFAFFVHFLNS